MKKHLAIQALAVIFSLSCPLLPWTPASAEVMDQINTLRTRAATLIQDGKYSEAIEYYRQLAVLQPNNVDNLKDYMWALWQAHRNRETAEIASRVTVLAPTDLEAWKLMGRAYQASGNKKEALRAFRQTLALQPGNVQLQEAIASMEEDSRNYGVSIQELEKIHNQSPSETDVMSRLGEAQVRQGLYSQATETWSRVAERNPQNLEVRFQKAHALYYSGQWDTAIQELRSITAVNPGYAPAVDLLTDDCIARGDKAGAQLILENSIFEFGLDEEARILKLADLYEETHQLDKSLKTLNRFLSINPTNFDALYLKAVCLMEKKKYVEAARAYEQILALNPWSIVSYTGLAEAQAAMRHMDQAVKTIEQAREQDPTDPYLLLKLAAYFYDSGNRIDSQRILLEWLKENPEPAVPALVYHRLTPQTRDAILAYSINTTNGIFESHLQALQHYGYTPVTAEQMDGWSRWLRPLPPHPILIAFDDARLDSFTNADPLLEKYGFKATMFIPLINVEANLPGYATWDLIEQYQNNGRWEIQAHGDLAHGDIPIDAEGHKGRFLANRKWLSKESRLETVDEWTNRIMEDHKRDREKMANHLGRTPIAYAFPDGEFGQNGIPNDPQAASLNLRLAREAFGTCYHQDNYGMNVRSRDSMLLTRLEPDHSWSGDQLVHYLIDHDPRVMMYNQLLQQASWDLRIHEAYTWLNNVRVAGASTSTILADEARIHYSAGDYTGAEKDAKGVLSLTPGDADMTKLLQDIHSQGNYNESPDFYFWKDNRDRENWAVRNNFYFRLKGNTRIALDQLYSIYSQTTFSSAYDKGIGVGVIQPLGLFHNLAVHYTEHALTTAPGTADTYTAYGLLRSQWTDYVNSEFEVGRGLSETAPALNDNIFIRYIKARGYWTQQNGFWSASAKGDARYLTDNNNEYVGELQAGYRFFPDYNLKGVYRFTFDDMKFISPDYYSPQHLIVNQVGIEYAMAENKPVQAYVNFLPGVGSEDSVRPEYVQDIEIGFPLKFSKSTELTPSFNLTTTPTYHRQNYALFFSHQF